MTAEQLEELLGNVTQGPWQVVKDLHPYTIEANDFGPDRHRNHTDTRIFTTYDHPQAKSPDPVVNRVHGLGCRDFIFIREPDATIIALATLASRVLAAEKLVEAAEKS